jgi:hypothetical protein
MQCERCHREMASSDPIYRVEASDPGAYVREACAGCCAKEWPWARWWRAPEPCKRCGRPVISDKRRKRPKHITCSHECRKAVYVAISRERRRRGWVKALACALCGASFMPKRSDARYCSVACKQKAFRRRTAA